jgi:hypothetical protein
MPEWETMIGYRLKETAFVRADLSATRAWTLHPDDRGERFEAALPSLIERIEQGVYPAGQGGYYDLQLDVWT